MRDEYLTARRSAMVIRIVKPSELVHRIVPERRPLSFDAAEHLYESKCDTRAAAASIAACIILLFVFGYVITLALEWFLTKV
jgi:hypothetical protein